MKTILFMSGIVLLLFAGCKKDDDENNTPVVPSQPSLIVNINYGAGSDALNFDTIKYTNAAGNNYSVTTLMYYLSDICLIKPDSQKLRVKEWLYVDARSVATNTFSFSNVPDGQYIGMTFNIGLDSIQNVPDGLPLTSENSLMEWPVPMGGGYHFLKMEGHWLDGGVKYGYGLHLGRNLCKCPVTIYGNFCIGASCSPVNLHVDVDEWFQNPYLYDLNIDGNYIMGNDTAMYIIAQNGTDVFSIR